MEVKFQYVDILNNIRIKEWLKHYSNFPAFPQVYVNGKFVGGSEIVIDLIESEEFINMIP
jgi:monothiol glutaredoxin